MDAHLAPGHPPTRRLAEVLGAPRIAVAVGLAVFLFSLQGVAMRATYGALTSADEPQYLLTALSLAEDFDLDISNQRYSGAYRAFHEALLPVQTVLREDGKRLSPHGPLLPVLLVPGMLTAGWVGAKVTLSLLGGGLAAAVFLIAVRRLGATIPFAAVTAVVLGMSPPLAVYATQVYPEIVAALFVTLAIGILAGTTDSVQAGQGPSPWSVAALAMFVAALPWLAVKYVPIALVLSIGAVVRWRRRRRQLIALLAALALASVAYLAFNNTVYGGWTPYAAGDFFVAGEFTAIGPDADLLGRSQRLIGLLIDRGFGLAAWQPAFLLAVPFLTLAVRRRSYTDRLLLAIVAAGWLTATFFAQTMHGWWWPGRQVVVVLPALALLLMRAMAGRRAAQRAVGAAALLGVVNYVWLGFETRIGQRALIVDFTETASVPYRLVRTLLPDYLYPSSTTWVLHGVWLGVLAGAVWWLARQD